MHADVWKFARPQPAITVGQRWKSEGAVSWPADDGEYVITVVHSDTCVSVERVDAER